MNLCSELKQQSFKPFFLQNFRQNGQPVETGMAVVIQEMVAAEAAGVLFTRDPINGDPSKIVITANFGLGEVFFLILGLKLRGYVEILALK